MRVRKLTYQGAAYVARFATAVRRLVGRSGRVRRGRGAKSRGAHLRGDPDCVGSEHTLKRKSEGPTRFEPAPNFGKLTGMIRDRCDGTFSCLRPSYQPDEKPADMSEADCRWMLMDGHVERCNLHRANNYSPSGKTRPMRVKCAEGDCPPPTV